MRIYDDLHLHSCLSPCSSDDMMTSNIVNMALLLGYDMIALTDHNSCRNTPAAVKIGEENGLTVVPEKTPECLIAVLCGALKIEWIRG